MNRRRLSSRFARSSGGANERRLYSQAMLTRVVDRLIVFTLDLLNVFVVLYNKSLNDWSLRKPVILFLPQCFPWETKITVSLSTSH